MATCPPLLVDSVVDQIRPPDPRRAPGAQREGTVEAPASAWTTGERPVRRSRPRLRPLRSGAGS
jgi:hypothetical protein